MMIENHIDFLKSELEARQKKNAQFSLRSFARLLEISPAQLSQILSGKRVLTAKMALHLAGKLALSPYEKEGLLDSISGEKKKVKSEQRSNTNKVILEEDQFRIISDWYHFAILSLTEIQENKSDGRWIGRRINIPVRDACEARDRLVRLSFIEVRSGTMFRTTKPIITNNDYISESIRRNHKQNLNLAIEKIDSVPIDKREYTSITMPVNLNKIKQAKNLMREFKRQIADLLESGKKTEVYTLSLQLFPISTSEEKS